MSKPDVMDVDTASSDDDPITATYNVFLNPSLPQGRRLIILQQPNRTDDAPRPAPTELRLKSHSGMVEVDLPLDNTEAYDRDKGLRWGRILQSSMAAKNGGSHGLAGGFGVGAVQQRGRKKGDDPDEDEYMDWNEAVRQGKVLKTQTLGGQYPDTDEVQYMVGVFQGKNLHLTPVSSLVHLRPQLHHLDAATQQERALSSSTSKEQATPSSSAARAIHMTIKNPTDGDALAVETMADRLRYVQTEHWRKMRYTDENDESAWEVYNQSLFLSPTDVVPRFGAKWDNKTLLEAVSGIVKPNSDIQPVKVEEVVQAKGEREDGKSRGRSGAAGSRRGRAKTVQVDVE